MMWIVFDTETTGLTYHPAANIHLQPRIIEFAAVFIDCERGQVCDERSILINPLIDLTAEITRITGLKTEDLLDKPTFPEVLPTIAGYFEMADRAVAHNYQFDESMLRNDCVRCGLPMLKMPDGLCTVQLYHEEFGYGPKLVDLYKAKMGRALAQTHRALDDANALAEIIIKEQLWTLFPN
jgi:DNA polymerase III epsilon subunit-like protein